MRKGGEGPKGPSFNFLSFSGVVFKGWLKSMINILLFYLQTVKPFQFMVVGLIYEC